MKYEGEPIESVQFEPADQPLTGPELDRALPFKIGSVFHARELQVAIQNLFATGRFSDIAVDATESGRGVALRFLTKRAYFVGRVVISRVKEPPNSGQLASATKLGLGLPYVNGDQTGAVDALKNLLKQNGFYHATVEGHARFEPHTEEANLSFDIVPGKRARFEEPSITGVPGSSDSTPSCGGTLEEAVWTAGLAGIHRSSRSARAGKHSASL